MTLLSQLTAGQEAKVVAYASQGEVALTMSEMGILPGETLRVVRFAPLGDPMEIKVKGYLLALRKDEASLVEVELL